MTDPSRHRLRSLLVLSLLLCGACQDHVQSPDIWTVESMHKDVGLSGGHQLECAGCHAGVGFKGAAGNCAGCHLSLYEQTTQPDHTLLGYPEQCAECHEIDAWQPAFIAHDTLGFALEGAHARVFCSGCHADNVFGPLPSDCWSCHETDFVAVADPGHVALQLSHQCTDCHDTAAWTPATFDHDSTDFALTGSHIETACVDCHTPAVLAAAPTDCWSCHELDFDAALDPSHVALQLSPACAECHDTEAWAPATFAHDSTEFALTGAHIETACVDCHTPAVLAEAPTDCWSCHEVDFNKSSEPGHVALQLSQDCTECHDTEAWTPSSFDHGLTEFALTGAHIETACADCHTPAIVDEVPTDCWSCHELDFNKSELPGHVALQLSQECAECHDTAAWAPASFDHGLTAFALTGAHIETACVDCHTPSVLGQVPTDCVACHEVDEPVNHFGPACIACHTTAAWEPSTFNHERLFPLSRGNHSRYRNDCGSCHLVPADYAIFTCTDCHDNEHTRTRTDGRHRGVRNYIYESAACYQCHPAGRE